MRITCDVIQICLFPTRLTLFLSEIDTEHNITELNELNTSFLYKKYPNIRMSSKTNIKQREYKLPLKHDILTQYNTHMNSVLMKDLRW